MGSKIVYNDITYDRIKRMSKILNRRHRYVFEFRNVEWFNTRIRKLFRKNNWSYVISNVNNSEHCAGNLENGFNPPLKKQLQLILFILGYMEGAIYWFL
jgi:hypothetical protein